MAKLALWVQGFAAAPAFGIEPAPKAFCGQPWFQVRVIAYRL
jgi:hypothetical protein